MTTTHIIITGMNLNQTLVLRPSCVPDKKWAKSKMIFS